MQTFLDEWQQGEHDRSPDHLDFPLGSMVNVELASGAMLHQMIFGAFWRENCALATSHLHNDSILFLTF